MIIAEFFIEIFGESFLNLSSKAVSDENANDKTKKAAAAAAVIGLITLICLIIGIALLCEESGKFITAGVVFISIFAVYLIIVIAANIIRLIRKRIKNK